MKSKVITFLFLGFMTLGHVSSVFAQGANGADDGGGANGASQANGSGDAVSLQNPLKTDSLMGFFDAILDIIMVFAVPLIIFFIIFAGFQYVMAQGNPDGVGKAHKALLYAIIGGVIILGAKVLLAVIAGTVASF